MTHTFCLFFLPIGCFGHFFSWFYVNCVYGICLKVRWSLRKVLLISGMFLSFMQEHLSKETHLHEEMSNNFSESFWKIIRFISKIDADSIHMLKYIFFHILVFFIMYANHLQYTLVRYNKKKCCTSNFFNFFLSLYPRFLTYFDWRCLVLFYNHFYFAPWNNILRFQLLVKHENIGRQTLDNVFQHSCCLLNLNNFIRCCYKKYQYFE